MQTNKTCNHLNWRRVSFWSLLHYLSPPKQLTSPDQLVHLSQILVGLIALPIFVDGAFLYVALGVIALITSFLFVAIKKCINFRYCLANDKVYFKLGGIFLKEIEIPVSTIDSISVSQPRVFKRLGLYSVEITTPGQSGSDISIPALSHENAEEIKAFLGGFDMQIDSIVGKEVDTDLDVQTDEISPSWYPFSITMPVLIFLGLSQVSVFFGGLYGKYIAQELIEALEKSKAEKIPLTMEQLDYISPELLMFLVFSIPALVAIVISIIAGNLSDRRFTFRKSGSKLVRQSGLIKKQTIQLEEGSIQTVDYEKPWFFKLKKRVNVRYRSIFSISELVEGSQVINIPCIKELKARRILNSFISGFGDLVDKKQSVSSYYYKFLLAVDLNIIMLFAWLYQGEKSNFIFMLVVCVLTFIAFIHSKRTWRIAGIGITDNHLIAGFGSLNQRFSIANLEKIQKLKITRGPIQRKLGLCSIKIHFSYGTRKVRYVSDEVAEQLESLTLSRIKEVPSWA